MSATSSAGVPHPYLHRSAGRASVPGPDRGASGRARPTEARFYPSYDEEQPRPGGPTGPTGPGGPGGAGGPGRRGPRPRWGRIALVAGIAVVVLALLGGVGAWLYARNLN